MNKSVRIVVGEEESGSRLGELLARRLGRLSRMYIRDLVRGGACSVNGETADGGRRVRAGELVEISYDSDRTTAMTPEPLPLSVVYEDAHLVVIDKLPGVLMHPTHAEKTGTLANALAYHLNRETILMEDAGESVDSQETGDASPVVRPGIVHRLDRATSGLVVVAKTQRALSTLSRHFYERRVEKGYLALLEGTVAADELIINAPIDRDPGAHPKWQVMETGRHAETILRVLDREVGRTLVELTPVTGRTNQLRIHTSHIDHPIVGDEWYGRTATASDEPPDPAPRLCLHAYKLAFHHPAGEGWLAFETAAPDFARRVISSRA